jgi:hypothetical protein
MWTSVGDTPDDVIVTVMSEDGDDGVPLPQPIAAADATAIVKTKTRRLTVEVWSGCKVSNQ